MERTREIFNCKVELDKIRDMLQELVLSLTERYESHPDDVLCNNESIYVA